MDKKKELESSVTSHGHCGHGGSIYGDSWDLQGPNRYCDGSLDPEVFFTLLKPNFKTDPISKVPLLPFTSGFSRC
ncbi:hypothetical protein GLOIN_2v764233 [Rhizophagus irregularis DAOM 181602=DAOM 197198]|nr:hypothetical protein GLOIN_2v764233 [Rhizophagus irregularis DAOM 181602=DAOM 197198]